MHLFYLFHPLSLPLSQPHVSQPVARRCYYLGHEKNAPHTNTTEMKLPTTHLRFGKGKQDKRVHSFSSFFHSTCFECVREQLLLITTQLKIGKFSAFYSMAKNKLCLVSDAVEMPLIPIQTSTAPGSYRKRMFTKKRRNIVGVREVLNSFLVADNALEGSFISTQGTREENASFVDVCACHLLEWVEECIFLCFSASRVKKLSSRLGWGGLKREMRTVCAWELFVLSEKKNAFLHVTGERVSERWKSTRETLQHCMSLIASQGTIRLLMLSLSFLKTGEKAGTFPNDGAFPVKRNELEETISHQERWCLM